MKLRAGPFIIVLGIAFLASPVAPEAGPPEKVSRIGLFHVGLDHVPPSLEGLRDGLRALGYDAGTAPMPKVSTVVDGRNVRLDWRNLADEKAAREAAKEFVRDRVDLIVAFESQTVRAAQAATSDIPVVFLHVTDPVADGFVKSLSRPGGNLTGFGEFLEELFVKRLALFKEMIPRLRHLLVLVATDDPSVARILPEVRSTAAILGLELTERTVTDQADLEQAFAAAGSRVDGAFVASSTLVTKFFSLIIRLATARHLPVPGHRKGWAERGALFSYGADFYAVGRQAAKFVDEILNGAKPADLPVQQLTQLEFIVNLKTAKALGLTIPPSLLLRADQVIE